MPSARLLYCVRSLSPTQEHIVFRINVSNCRPLSALSIHLDKRWASWPDTVLKFLQSIWCVPQTNTSPTRVWLAFLCSRRLHEDGTPDAETCRTFTLVMDCVLSYFIKCICWLKYWWISFLTFCPALNGEFDIIPQFCTLFFYKALSMWDFL